MSDTILIIDDDIDFRRLINHTLERHGYELELKSSAQGGLAYFQENSRDIKLVIIDVLMPGMMGPELVKRLRSIRPDVKLMFASAYAVEIIDETTGQAFPLLHKPLRTEQLLEKVGAMVKAEPVPSATSRSSAG